MIVTVFRARIRPEAAASYFEMAPRMAALAKAMPGYISHKAFVAEDGERVTLVEFDSEAALQGWATHPDHLNAKSAGRSDFYDEYRVQICQVLRDKPFRRRGLS